MIVTTSARGQQKLEKQAQQIADSLQLPYIKRNRSSVSDLMERFDVHHVLLITTNGVRCVVRNHLNDPFFFHPSSAMFRIKRLIRGEHDPFADAAQLKPGMSVLDCTLGMASDAIVASYIVGSPGRIIGLESVPILSFIVQLGLQKWTSNLEELTHSMKRIQVMNTHYMNYLKKCPTNTFDVVYFDPMFESTNEDSISIGPLKKMANYEQLSLEALEEAKRVASKRVILKDSSYSSRFNELGFEPKERKYASHWFGTIELG